MSAHYVSAFLLVVMAVMILAPVAPRLWPRYSQQLHKTASNTLYLPIVCAYVVSDWVLVGFLAGIVMAWLAIAGYHASIEEVSE